MKRLFVFATLLAFLAPLGAQPPDPAPGWVVKSGNPATIEPPAGWNGIVETAAFSPDGKLLAIGGGTWENDNQPQRGAVLLFDGRTGAPGGELRGHDDIVQRLAFSPDGKLLATQSQDGAVFLWDMTTRKLLHRLSEGHGKSDRRSAMLQPRLWLGAWSPDGKTLATYEAKLDTSVKPAAWVWTTKLFDASSGKVTHIFAARPGSVNRMAWTSDGKNLLTALELIRDGKLIESAVEVFDAQSGDVVRRAASSAGGNQIVIAFSPNARYALSNKIDMAPDGKAIAQETAQLWDLENDRVVWAQSLAPRAMRGVEFSRDGETLYTGNADSEIVIRDAATGEVRQTLPFAGCNEAADLALSADGTRLVKLEQASDAIQFWRLDEPIPAPRYVSHVVVRDIYNLRALAWDGDLVRTVTDIDDEKNGLRVGREIRIETWNAKTGALETQSIPESKILSAGALSSGGEKLAVELGTQPEPAYYKTEGIGIYDVRTGKRLFLLPEEYGIESITWSPDGKTLTTSTGGTSVKLWNSETGELRGELPTEGGSTAWSPSGKLFATGSRDGQIQIFDVETGREQTNWETNGAVRRLVFSPDGKTLAAGVTSQGGAEFTDSSVQLFEVATGKARRSFATQSVLCDMHWTPDSSGIAASSNPNPNRRINGQLRIWDAATGDERIAIDDRCGIDSFTFSPDGTSIAAHNGMRVRVWNVK
jgi:WD40 repeat protein